MTHSAKNSKANFISALEKPAPHQGLNRSNRMSLRAIWLEISPPFARCQSIFRWPLPLGGIVQGLCRPTTLPRTSRARIELQFRESGATYCGTDPEIIACRADNVVTELNTKDYRFRASPGTMIGSGAIELDLLPVLVHEMGHWIGLRHLDQGASIMASNAERARCIDEATIAALQKVLEVAPSGPQAFRLHARRAASQAGQRERHQF